MKFVTDLHLHSKYSRAVSQNMLLANMADWARIKGINVIASSDFTHPFWFDDLKKELVDAGNGLFKLKNKSSQIKTEGFEGKNLTTTEVQFLLSCEISSIYSQGGKGRRVHNLFMFPSLESVDKFNKELVKRRANLRSDGRPIVGMSARDLAEIALTVDSKCLIVPAHIWAPWFSIFGSFSGFDSVDECFADMADKVYGVETGLSSDPAMNWSVGDLNSRAILSFSDAHSLEKLGREATVFEAGEISYQNIYEAVKSYGNSNSDSGPRVAFTIEFYPEEGKYHFTGHRDCDVSLSPQETKEKSSICSVCGKGLTVGVMHRVKELKSQNAEVSIKEINGVRWMQAEDLRPSYVYLVPLMEVLAEAFSVGVGTQKVRGQYAALINSFGSEFNVLLKAEAQKIAKIAGDKVAEAIEKVRTGNIEVEPGYDGKFGVVKIWKEASGSEEKSDESQLNLFA